MKAMKWRDRIFGEKKGSEESFESSDLLYLQKLKWDPELKKSWLSFFVSNFRVVMLLIMLSAIWGVYSFVSLPRESNPEVKIPVATVFTMLPGASPSDVEELVTKKVETAISGLKGIDKITSYSSNSTSSLVVEFEAGENLEDSIRRLKDKVDSIQGDLPDEAEDSSVNEISFDDRPIFNIELSGKYDGFTLRQKAEELQDELEKISGVREVQVSGGEEREIEVAYNPEKLSALKISADQANQIIASSNLLLPAGSFSGEKYNYSVKSDARFFDAEQVRNLPIISTDDGAIVYLKDLAEVKEQAIEKTVYSRFSVKGERPQNAVSISLVKKTGGSILKTVDEAKTKVEAASEHFPEGMEYAYTTDMSERIREDFDQLTHDFFLTLFLVSLVLVLLVGVKEAFVAGMAIPLTFFISFGVMDLTGISLNFLSIFSLLLSLGLLVDDAIVVVSATKQYLKTGKFTPEQAVILVLRDFKWVLVTTTLTTVWAFLPLLLATGIIGEFIKSIPITVSVTLMASLAVALMINHPMAAILERIRFTRSFFCFIFFAIILGGISAVALLRNAAGYSVGLIALVVAIVFLRWYLAGGRGRAIASEKLVNLEWENPEMIKAKLADRSNGKKKTFWQRIFSGITNINVILPLYEKQLRYVLKTKKRRWAALAATLILFLGSVALPATGIVPTEFFSASDEDTLSLNLEAPSGLRVEETNKIVERVEAQLLNYPEIEKFSTLVGQAGSEDGGGSSSSNLASVSINLVNKDDRQITSYDLAEKIRSDLKGINEAKITVESPRGGPPSGSAFEARIVGEDLQVLDKTANDLKGILNQIDGVINIDVSLKEAPAEYTFLIDRERLKAAGLTIPAVSSFLRMAVSGTEISKVIRENKEIKIMARLDDKVIPDLAALQNLQLLNATGNSVFLKDVAKVELKPSVETITRTDQKRTVLLSAGVEGKTLPNQVLAEFQKKVKEQYSLPAEYEIVYGGENEQNAESVLSILRATVIAGLLIFSTMIIQFNSFKKALIVLATFPLALIGVFVGLAIFRINLSFPGLIGILALFGIVVKNAIILIDKINLNLASDIPFQESIIDAGKSRLEAIFITSICTIFGIIPITLSNELWKALGGTIIFGLSLSSFFTLIIVPVLFATLISEEEEKRERLKVKA